MATYTFTPPAALVNPPYLPTSTPTQVALFKFSPPQPAYVTVFMLQDGTFTQSYPTPENANTNTPYPIGAPDNLVARTWNPYTLQEVDTAVVNPVVAYWQVPTVVSPQIAAALTAAGYGANIVVT